MSKETVSTLSVKVKDQRHDFRNLRTEMKAVDKDHEDRIRKLENWKIELVGKLSGYVAISLFLGSIASQIAIVYFRSLFTN